MSHGFLNLPVLSGGGGGAASWQEPVQSVGDLPASGNTPGDARVVIDANTPFVWGDDSAWHAPSGGGNAFSIIQPPSGQAPTALTPSSVLTLRSSDGSVGINGDDIDNSLDFSANLSGALKIDGSNSPTADINWGAHSLNNVTLIAGGTLGGGLNLFDGTTGTNGITLYGGQTYLRGNIVWRDNNTYDLGGAGSAPKDVHIGNGIAIAEGTNKRMGIATLVAGTVTISNTSVTANTRIFLTGQEAGGTPGAVNVSSRTAGTSFVITSTSALDTSTVAWMLVEPD